MVEIVQHKEILRRHMPEALRLAVAKNVENRLFAQAISPTVKFPDIFLFCVFGPPMDEWPFRRSKGKFCVEFGKQYLILFSHVLLNAIML